MIRSILLRHAGKYGCRAQTSADSVFTEAELLVRGKIESSGTPWYRPFHQGFRNSPAPENRIHSLLNAELLIERMVLWKIISGIRKLFSQTISANWSTEYKRWSFVILLLAGGGLPLCVQWICWQQERCMCPLRTKKLAFLSFFPFSFLSVRKIMPWMCQAVLQSSADLWCDCQSICALWGIHIQSCFWGIYFYKHSLGMEIFSKENTKKSECTRFKYCTSGVGKRFDSRAIKGSKVWQRGRTREFFGNPP